MNLPDQRTGCQVWVKTSDNEYNATLSYFDDNRIILTSPSPSSFVRIEIPWIEVQLMNVFYDGKIISLITDDTNRDSMD